MALLETERLTLRLPREDDTEELFKVKNDENVRKFLPDLISHDCTPEDVRRYVFYAGSAGECVYAIVLRETGKIIGMLEVNSQNCLGETVMGCQTKSEFTRHGFATEALNAISDYCFYTFKPKFLTAIISPDNEAAYRTCEKCGYRLYEKRAAYDYCYKSFLEEYYYFRRNNPDNRFRDNAIFSDMI